MNHSPTAATYHAYRQRRYFASLNAIRAIAILAVVWHHTTTPLQWLPLSARGFLGVDLFFILSGFLIVTLLLRERERNGEISLSRFYMRRVLRIFPLYYGILFALTILFLVVAPGNDMAIPFLAAVPFYVTYTSNMIREETLLAVAWSLAAEEQFYLVWPPIERYLARFALPLLALLLLINQLINYRVILAAQHDRLEILQSTFTPILLGVLLAYLLHNRATFESTARLVGNRWAVPVLLVLMLLLINSFPLATDISGTPRLLIHLLMTLLIAASVVPETHLLERPFTWGPLVRIGIISYGMYLFHMFCVHVARTVLQRQGLDNMFLLFFITLLLTVIVSEISFRFYESPFLKLKDRFSSSIKVKRPTQAVTP